MRRVAHYPLRVARKGSNTIRLKDGEDYWPLVASVRLPLKGFCSEGFNACQRRQRLFVALSRGFYRVDVCGVSRGNNRGSLIVILTRCREASLQ